MVEVSQKAFEAMVARAIDEIPDKYAQHLDNVGFVIEDEPSTEQREKLHLINGVTLFGLYEGIPLTRRGSSYSGVLPDKITIFRLPILERSSSESEAYLQVRNTIWHEVAHYFGLGHGRIHQLESDER